MSDTTPKQSRGEGATTEQTTGTSATSAAKHAALAEGGKQALDNLVSRSKHAMDSLTGRSKRSTHAGTSESRPALDRFQETMREPTTGAAVAGAAVAGAIGIFGVGPALLGATTGYVVYRSLRKRNAQSES